MIVIDQRSNKSRTLPFETRKNIASIALSPDAHILLVVDEGETIFPTFDASDT
jgi:periodic tryptophan protein 2